MIQLGPDLLIEIAKSCIVSSEILEVVKPHLKYSYIQQAPLKEIFKYIFDYHSAHSKPPTVGILAQNVTSKDSLPLIGRIRECNIYDRKDEILLQFQEFIQKSWGMAVMKEGADLYNQQKQDEAIELSAREWPLIQSFSLKRDTYGSVIRDFTKILEKAKHRSEQPNTRVPTGIPQFDYHMRGGIKLGASLLGVGRSGSGKSTFLRSLGYHAMFRGFNVIHFSAEDTKEEIEEAYTAAWTGISLDDLREGNLDGANWNKIEKARQAYISQCGEIKVHAFEQFHTASILDCRNILIDILKEMPIHLVIFDYLEKFSPGDGKRYSTNQDGETKQKTVVAEKIINIGKEFNVACATMTQASNIPKEKWNNPNWVMDRENISNAKQTIDPFQYSVTLNQTDDENDNEIMRVHEEKCRYHKIFSYSSTYHIQQKRNEGKFIDVAETKRRFWDEENKKIIRHIVKS